MGRPGMHNEEKTLATIQDNIAALKKKIDGNVYIVNETDVENVHIIIDLYANYPKHYIKMMLSEKHKDRYGPLVEWVYGKTSFLKDGDGFRYDLQTRLNWLFNGKGSWAKCAAGCGRTPALNRSLRLNDPFPEYCCTKCSTNAAATIEKARITRYAANGGKWESDETRRKIEATVQAKLDEDPDWYRKRTAKCEATKVRNGHDPKWNNRDKMRETVAAHIEEDPAYYEKITEKTKATKTARYGDPNWVNPEKARETNIALRGVDNPTKDPRVKAKSKDTFRRNHPGLTSSFQLPDVPEKVKATVIAHYGVDNPLKSPRVRSKIRHTILLEYGVDHVWKARSIRKKCDVTKLEKYGTLSPRRKYLIDGEYFDSSWEAYLWAWCVDTGKNIKRNPCVIIYEFDGKKYEYYPDFEIDGTLVEVKGDQFFKPDGTMFCPYRYIDWTDEQYYEMCRRYEAKHQCMLRHGVKIFRHSDMVEIMREVDRIHGKKWLKSHKVI